MLKVQQRSIKYFSRFCSSHFLLLLCIILLGGGLRVYQLDVRSLWFDEAYSVALASQSFSEILTDRREFHPPLYLGLLHVWIYFFGSGEQVLRLFSVIFGVAAIASIGLLGFVLYNYCTGLFAALLMAIMVFPLHYSREIRGYSLLMFLSIGSAYFSFKSLQQDNKRDWLGYFICTVGLAYTHYYWIFQLLAQNLYVLLFYRREKQIFLRWIGTQTGVFLCFLPWLLPFLQQTGTAMQGNLWIPRRGMNFLLETIRSYTAYLIYPQIVWGYIFLFLLGLFQLRQLRGTWRWTTVQQSLESYRWEVRFDTLKRSGFLLLWFICPILIPFLLSRLFTPIFWPRYTIGAIPAFYLVLSHGFWLIPTMFLRVLVIVAICIASLASLQQYYTPSNWSHIAHYYIWENEPWREWVAFLNQHVEPDDIIVLAPANSSIPFRYYAKDALPYHALSAMVNDETRTRLDTITRDKKRLWMLARKRTRPKGVLLVDYLHSRYQPIPIASPLAKKTMVLFDLTQPP
jgi:uncharacterized membrane protein